MVGSSNDTLNFYVRMKDFMSGPLIKAGQTASSTFKLIQNNLKATEKETEFLTKSVGELRQELREVNKVRFGTVLASEFKQASVAAKDLQRQIAVVQGTVPGSRSGGRGAAIGAGLMRGFGSLLPALGIAGMVAGGGGLLKSSVQSSFDFASTAKSFEILAGSKNMGGQLARDLRRDSSRLGEGVYKNAQTLMGYGMGAKDVRSTLGMVGDVGMGDADKMRSLSLAIGQVKAAGKLAGQEMIQFVNAGFNPLQQMAESTGKSFATLKKEMEAGNITYEMVMKSFKDATNEGGRFANMLEQIGETGAGAAAKLKSQWENFKIDLGDTLTPFATTLMGVANNLLQGIKGPATPQSKVFGTERGSITALLNTATNMPVGSGRTAILNQLSRQFPDQFGSMDLSGKSNAELSQLAQKVNQEYGFKISAQTSREKLQYVDATVKRLSGSIGNINNRKALLAAGYKEQALTGSGLEGMFGVLPSTDNANSRFGHLLNNFNPQLSAAIKESAELEKKRATADYFERATGYANLANNPAALSKALGGNKKKMAAFSALANKHITYGAGGWKSTATEGILSTLEGMLNSGKANVEYNDSLKGSGGDAARQITGSGPRQINISGVKFAETININGGTASEARDGAEAYFNEMFIRLLQSGARVQG